MLCATMSRVSVAKPHTLAGPVLTETSHAKEDEGLAALTQDLDWPLGNVSYVRLCSRYAPRACSRILCHQIVSRRGFSPPT